MLRSHATRAAVAALVIAGVAGGAYVVTRKTNAVDSATSTIEVDCEKAEDKCGCYEAEARKSLLDCRSDRALTLITSAMQACKANPNIVAIQSETLAAAGHYPAAVGLAREVLKTDPKNRFARRALAISGINDKNFAEVDTLLASLLSEDPKDPAAIFYTALAAARRDRYNDARQGFLKTLRLHKTHIDARYNLALLTSEAGAHDEAAHHLARLKEIAPNSDVRVSSAEAMLKSRSGTPGSAITLVQDRPDAG